MLVLDVSIDSGFALPYRWSVLGVGFGRSDERRFRANNVGPRSVLVLDIPHGGGFDLFTFAKPPRTNTWP